MPQIPRFQTASDVIRDGLGLELLDEEGGVIAEVFRYDRSNNLTISLFRWDLPLTDIEKMIAVARLRLGEFEDGTPLPKPIE